MRESSRVGLIGAGGISEIHGRALRDIESAEVVAVVDRDLGRARNLARATGAGLVLEDAAELIDSRAVDAVHVLVPPHLHAALAAPFLEAGIHVLCEKPLAPSVEECERLRRAAEVGGALLAVNHNLLFDPVHRRLVRELKSGALGPLRHLSFHWSVPLGPLQARRFGHWMFQDPRHIVFEQGVHPLSVLCDLGGASLAVRCLLSPERALVQGLTFVDEWQVSLQLERCTAQLLLSFGRPMKVAALTAICDDGVVRADYLNGRLVVERRRPTELAPGVRDGLHQALSLGLQSLARGRDAVLQPLGLRPDPDPFTASMRASLGSFYARLGATPDDVGARFATDVVRTCESIAAELPRDAARRAEPAAPSTGEERDAPSTCDVALLGGTGVIGRALVEELVGAGWTVRVLARGIAALDDRFHHERVQLVGGSAEDDGDLSRAVRGARRVVDLFYVTEGEDVERRMVAGAERIARACLAAGVERLVYLSSTAALYLGDGSEVVTGATRADPRSEKRSPYSRGKALSERRLGELQQSESLAVTILRPGIVVGEGAVALHPGIGRVVDEQHCIGWGAGTNPMAFVLVGDVARGIRAALEAEGVAGRTYNLVGAVPLSARDYLSALGKALRRPLAFHPQSLAWFQTVEILKWILKRLAGRRDAVLPSLRDSRSRAMYASFDLSDARRDLGWQPESDRAAFLRRAVDVHRRPQQGEGRAARSADL